jgi:hypothetical protein
MLKINTLNKTHKNSVASQDAKGAYYTRQLIGEVVLIEK